jgi:hypothetical protein
MVLNVVGSREGWELCTVTDGVMVGIISLPLRRNQWNHDTPANRPRNHTFYDIPSIRFAFQVTQKDISSSLMMAGYCRNM